MKKILFLVLVSSLTQAMEKKSISSRRQKPTSQKPKIILLSCLAIIFSLQAMEEDVSAKTVKITPPLSAAERMEIPKRIGLLAREIKHAKKQPIPELIENESDNDEEKPKSTGSEESDSDEEGSGYAIWARKQEKDQEKEMGDEKQSTGKQIGMHLSAMMMGLARGIGAQAAEHDIEKAQWKNENAALKDQIEALQLKNAEMELVQAWHNRHECS